MKYNSQTILCKICKEEIPCIFDEEDEVTVPQVASFSIKKSEHTNPAVSDDVKAITEAHPDKALIYLSCLNFHGPFPYIVNITKQDL